MKKESLNNEKLNNKSNNNKRIFLKLLFMFVLFLNVFSLKSFANKQAPIRGLKLDTLSSTVVNGITVPSVAISWEAPSVSDEIEIAPNLTDGDEIHQVERYDIRIRNLSLNETNETSVGVVTAGTRKFSVPASKLKTGSLYTICVYALHRHEYEEGEIVTYKDCGLTGETVPYIIFYTAPNVEVKTQGNGMVITFDDAGDWINYKIFYEMLSENPFDNGFDEDKALAVSKDNSNVRTFIDTSNGVTRTRIEYTLTGRSDIKAGKAYSVVIKAYDTIGDDYTVSISPDVNIYTCATEAPFTITEHSDDYLKLNWKGLNSVVNRVKEVLIFSGLEPGNLEQYARITNDNALSVEYYLIEKPLETRYFQLKVTYEDDETVAYSEILEYNPDLSRIIPGRPNVSASYSNSNLNINWSAFYYNDVVKFDTYYDLLVTDSISIVADTELNSESDFYVKSGTETANKVENTGLYTTSFNSYLTEVYDNNGRLRGYTSKEIQLNKVYYVRVIAKIKATNGEYSSEPTTIAVYVDYDGNIYYPPVLAKPPLVKRYVTDSEISIGFRQTWFEIMNLSTCSEWNSELWYNDGTISFEEIEPGTHIVLKSIADVNNVKALIANDVALNSNDFAFRKMDFSDDTKFEGYIVPYGDVEKYISTRKISNPSYDIGTYIKEINNSTAEDVWSELTVNKSSDDTGISYSTNFTNLQENILYFILIRSYRELPELGKIYSTYPSSIICITSHTSDDSEPVPTVPIMSLEYISDIQMKVKWQFTGKLNYEIRYSKTENLNTGKIININQDDLESLPIVTDGNNYILTINDLFPETTYYVWIKAKQVKGNLESSWSNALMVETQDVIPSPLLPPSGIGVAATTEDISSSFLTVEWTRTQEDLEMDEYEGTTIIKNISYIFEIADNIKFLDYKSVETGALVPNVSSDFMVIDKAVVRALNLRSSTRYYLRIKTRITVKDTETGDEIIKDSAYSIVKIFTTTSINEYDSELGGLELELEEKFETEYNSNEVEIKVLNDERLINDLILDGSFDFTIDFSKEGKKFTVRKFTMPLNVLLALERRDMNIVLKLKDMSLKIPAKAFNNSNYQTLMKSGGIESLTIQISEDNNIYFDAVEAKEITSRFNTKFGKVNIDYLDKYMDVNFDITNSAYYGKGTSNVKAVVYNPKTSRWDAVKEQYVIDYDLVFKVGKMGKMGYMY